MGHFTAMHTNQATFSSSGLSAASWALAVVITASKALVVKSPPSKVIYLHKQARINILKGIQLFLAHNVTTRSPQVWYSKWNRLSKKMGCFFHRTRSEFSSFSQEALFASQISKLINCCQIEVKTISKEIEYS